MLEIDSLTRVIEDVASRTTGPLQFRLLFQPTMALVFGIRHGISDARERRPAYFWTLFAKPSHGREPLRSGWKSMGTILILAVVADAVYQLAVLRWFYPREALIVAFILAVVPYVLIRGRVNRSVGIRRRRATDLGRTAAGVSAPDKGQKQIPAMASTGENQSRLRASAE